MTIHETSPPGTLDLNGVLECLGMSKKNLYATGLADPDLLDSWQVKPNTPRLWSKEQVGWLKWWLNTRQGLIALGAMKHNAPLKPQGDLEALFQGGYHDHVCPKCDGPAVVDRWDGDGRVWCPEPECGISPLELEEGDTAPIDLLALEREFYATKAANPDWDQSLWDFLIEAEGVSADDIWGFSPIIGWEAGQDEPAWL
jgi:hypothetical protein